MGKITDLHKPEGIRKILEGNNYSEEFINKLKTFYFNENDPEYEKNRLDNVCNVSIYFYLSTYLLNWNDYSLATTFLKTCVKSCVLDDSVVRLLRKNLILKL